MTGTHFVGRAVMLRISETNTHILWLHKINMRNSLNDHIHTKCARNLAFIYQFYEKEDEEVWGPVYNNCPASECMTASAASVSPCLQLKYAMQQLKMVCICTCSSQNSKEMQFFFTSSPQWIWGLHCPWIWCHITECLVLNILTLADETTMLYWNIKHHSPGNVLPYLRRKGEYTAQKDVELVRDIPITACQVTHWFQSN